MKQYAVIGLGRFGSSVARTLSDLGHEVLAIDIDEERVQQVEGFVTHAVQADATDESAMMSLGIRNVDVAIVSIGENLEASILATLILKDLGVRYVACKATSELHGKVLERVGADRVVYPERDMGVRVAHNLVSSSLIDYIELSPDYSIAEIVARPEFAGKTLRELNLRAKYDYAINIIAIRSGDAVRISPRADDKIHENDILVVMGSNEAIKKLQP
ncbi:MAG: TrkA family potassium uptake protein [Firmicutes bacterium]|nr:TrkA family potassium uptake protein [Bacillota bacterium]